MKGVVLRSGVNDEAQSPDEAAIECLPFVMHDMDVSSVTFALGGADARILARNGDELSFAPHGRDVLCRISMGDPEAEERCARDVSNVWTCISFKNAEVVDIDDAPRLQLS